MSKPREEVELTINEVRHKKRDGTLYIMTERLGWIPNGKDEFFMKVLYADVKNQKVSPDNKPKVQLQLTMLTEETRAYTFQFMNEARGRRDRDEIKDILSSKLPKFRRKIDDEMKEKNRLLMEDKDLFEVYKSLVASNILSPSEFWESRSDELSKDKKKQPSLNQQVGISPGFLAQIRPQTNNGVNSIRYNLTTDIIQSIFRTYPNVRAKFRKVVPARMTDKEFWELFFESHYFYKDRVHTSSQDIFADCDKKDDSELDSIASKGVSDEFNDIKYFKEDDSTQDDGYGTKKEFKETKKGTSEQVQQRSLIKRTNYHNIMIVQQSNNNSSNEKDNVTADPSCMQPKSKKAKLIESIQYDDLAGNVEKSSEPYNEEFQLQNPEIYSHGPTAESKNCELDYGAQEFVNKIHYKASRYLPKLTSVMNPDNAYSALAYLTQNAAPLSLDENSEALSKILTRDQCSKMKQIVLSSNELLRHFWLCFPPNTPELQEKLCRIHDNLKIFHQKTIASFKEELRRQAVRTDVTGHVEEMIHKAYEKYQGWVRRKNKTRR